MFPPVESLSMVISGTPPGRGKMLLLGLENGRAAAGSALGVVPVTVLAEGWDPPRISCMKKESVGGGGGVGSDDGPRMAWRSGPGPFGDVVEVKPMKGGGCGGSWSRILDESAEDRAVRMKKRESGNLAINFGFKENEMRESGYM